MPPTTLLRAKWSITLHEHVHVHVLMPGRLACSCLLVCLLCLQTVTGINDSAPQRHDSISNRITHYWKELSRICPSHNYTSCWHVDRSNWTDASRVQTTGASVAPLGDWSTFQLITYDGHGTRRVTGGDSWSIVLKGVGTNNLTVPARVFDEGDGTYTVAALLLRPATYSMIARLFYSNCLGLQSAAGSLLDWGRHLEYKDHCYIGARLVRHAVVVVPASAQMPACATMHGDRCTARLAGAFRGLQQHTGTPKQHGMTIRPEAYFMRENGTFLQLPCCKPRLPTTQPFTRVITYGDSTMRNNWGLLVRVAYSQCKPNWKPAVPAAEAIWMPCTRMNSSSEAEPIMDSVLQRCSGGLPMSVVPMGTDDADIARAIGYGAMYFNMGGFQFNDSLIKAHEPPLQRPTGHEFSMAFLNGWGERNADIVQRSLAHVRAGDFVMINLGLHYQRTGSFVNYQKNLQQLAGYLVDLRARTGAVIVWRSSFVVKEHLLRGTISADALASNSTNATAWAAVNAFHKENERRYVANAHFSTEARRVLFDSYSESVLVPLGFPIWDIYAFCHLGAYAAHDMVHGDALTSWMINLDMLDTLACPKL